MVATVAVATGGSHAAVAVPAAAVTRDADGATLVYVLDRAAGRVRARRVTVGAAAGTSGGDAALVTVGRGLAAGEPVVVAGQQRVRDGARVDVIAGDRPVAGGGQP
jgi:membrane fusion protein (multidrug efflux system)